ncbi:sensor histidine kinase [Longimicrobium sp.]|jgi:signal transduction histidine kinase|uniref:sensor histidine kinase n=1 Tax=Longimicrobium sp. TaxID=2029185 RepID=UPI002F91E109
MDLGTHPASERTADARIPARLLLLFWLGDAVLTLAHVYILNGVHGSRPSLGQLLYWVLPGYLVWALSVPAIITLARRFRFEGGGWRHSLPVHLTVSLVIASANMVVLTLFARARSGGGESFGTVLLRYVEMRMSWSIFTYWFFLAFYLALEHAQTAGARKVQASRLEAELANARLAALKIQVQPHFLFNALNSISSLVPDEPRAAQKMISELAELLRLTLAAGAEHDTPLRRELEVLDRYVAIEQVRFGDRLRVDIRVDDDALDAAVPTLLLQPLVENAVLHGIQPSLQGGTVRVTARREDSWLAIEVSDDGVGLGSGYAERAATRVGLVNTRERLRKRFGAEHSFAIGPVEPRGTRVSIRLPCSPKPEHALAAV